MKIYNSGGLGRGTIFVSPGAHHPDNTKWMESQMGSRPKPIMFKVSFEDTVAQVDQDLGEYMIKHGLAVKSPVTLPPKQAARNAEADNDRLKSENAALRDQVRASKVLLAAQNAA